MDAAEKRKISLASAENSKPPGCSARSQSNAYAKFNNGVRYDVLTRMTMKIAIFCDKMPCNMVDRYQRLTETAVFMFGEKE
jgi:hypothetical protein